MQPDLEIEVGLPADTPSQDGPMVVLGAQFEPLYGMVHRYLLHRFFDCELAEELTAETFYKAAASHRRLPAQSNQLRAWLLRTATNLANTHYRRTRRRRFLFERFARSTPRQTRDVDGDNRITDIRGVLSTLPPKYQTVIVLRYYLELPFDEIANILKCKESAARVRLSRATQEIRQRLGVQNEK